MKKIQRNKRGEFTSWPVRFRNFVIKWFIIFAVIGVPMFGAYQLFHQWLVTNFVYAAPTVSYTAPKEDNRSTKEKAISYLQSRGFTDEQIFQFTCLMYYENRGYDPYAYYVNTNGTVDRGLIMWNSKTAPIKISNECSFNYECSLEKFADYILDGGDWDRWLAFKNKCK